MWRGLLTEPAPLLRGEDERLDRAWAARQDWLAATEAGAEALAADRDVRARLLDAAVRELAGPENVAMSLANVGPPQWTVPVNAQYNPNMGTHEASLLVQLQGEGRPWWRACCPWRWRCLVGAGGVAPHIHALSA